jgi:hypothetical protein
MLGKNGIKVFDHIFPQKLTLTFLGDHSLTPCISYGSLAPIVIVCIVLFLQLHIRYILFVELDSQNWVISSEAIFF